MQSPYKTMVVYDLETGGFNYKHNSITEIAMVAIDMENLEIIDEFSAMIEPTLDFSERELDPLKEAKSIFKAIAEKDEDTGIKTLVFDNQKFTLRDLSYVSDCISLFWKRILENSEKNIFSLKELKDLCTEELSEVLELYYKYKYNPQALSATKITRDMLETEGLALETVFKKAKSFLEIYTIGNSKPIIAGHNIISFDNDFMRFFFNQFSYNFDNFIANKIFDSLEECRIKWFELTDYTLSTCANEVGLNLKDAHRAINDTRANAELIIEMLKLLRGQGNQVSVYRRRKYSFNY